jgi:hydrogenase nickel incorporation protein HypA/HybF
MHELTLAQEVIELVSREAEKNDITSVEKIVIEIGCLSGVEAEIFETALVMISKDSILENALRQIIRTTGHGRCKSCDVEFEMDQLLAVCPGCGGYPEEVTGGNEFRVVSFSGE